MMASQALTKARLTEEILQNLKSIVGDENVLTSPEALYVYSYDAAIDKASPDVVVFPSNSTQVAEIVRLAHKNKIPFIARGGGTNLCGGTIAISGGIIIQMSKMNRILDIDTKKGECLVEPGVINLHLQKALAPLKFFYAPDPASQKACTLGGNVANNSGGPRCLKYGVTSNHVLGMEWVFPNGEMSWVGIENPGYDLTGFLVGSEGTLGVATKIRLRILPQPKNIMTALTSFSSLEDAIRGVEEIVATGIVPCALEAMDKITIQAVEAFVHAGYPSQAEAVLLIELDEDEEANRRNMRVIEEICRKNHAIAFETAIAESQRQKLWEGRRGSYPALARLAPNVLVEDGAVPRSRLVEALKRIQEIGKRENLRVALIFHAGDGNLHPQIIFDERNAEETKKVKRAGYEMLKVCVELGGSISGEHGVGIDKLEAMKWLFTPETLWLFRRLKEVFDPEGIANPGKLIPVVGRPASQEIVGDFPASVILAPKSTEEASRWLRMASHQKRAVGIFGRGTKRKPLETVLLSSQGLNAVFEHDEKNFTVVVAAGMGLAELKAFLKPRGQFVRLWGEGSVGGILATRSSPSRDQVLGMTVVLSTGEIVKFGAKVMKNVAGYDAAKLLVGSWGTLGFITEIILKTHARDAASPEGLGPVLFEFNETFLKIRRVFDPQGLLNPSLIAKRKPSAVSGQQLMADG